jgi:hypothetical protein
MEVVKMDACKKIWFYTPAQLAAQAAGILAIPALLLALAITIC